ncbi:hypothetical protein [Photobacterium sp. R1]
MLAQEQTFPQCSGTLIYDLVIDGAGRVNSPEQAAIFCCVSGDKIAVWFEAAVGRHAVFCSERQRLPVFGIFLWQITLFV